MVRQCTSLVVVVLPPLNPGKESFGTRAIAVHRMQRLIDGIFRDPCLLTAGRIDDFLQARDQVFCSRHHEDIGVVVLRKALLGLASYAWDGELPAQAERAIPIAGAVLEREFWPKAVAARRDGNRYRIISCSAEEIRLKCFPDPFERAAPFGERNYLARSISLDLLLTPLAWESDYLQGSLTLRRAEPYSWCPIYWRCRTTFALRSSDP